MAQANQDEGPADLANHTVRRKRGRPRKDESHGSAPSKHNRQALTDRVQKGSDPFIGQVVSGVLDGRFDAGYMLTVQVGGRGNILRGLVFEPSLSVPISSANDVAPSVHMFERNEISMPSSTWQVPGRSVAKKEVPLRSQSRSEFKPLIEDLNISVSQMSPVDQVKDFQSTSGEGQKDSVDQAFDLQSTNGGNCKIIDGGQKNLEPTLVDQDKVLQSTSVDDHETSESTLVDQVMDVRSTTRENDMVIDGGQKNLEAALGDQVNDLLSMSRDSQKNLESAAIDQVKLILSDSNKEPANFAIDINTADPSRMIDHDDEIKPERLAILNNASEIDAGCTERDDNSEKKAMSGAFEVAGEGESDNPKVSDASNVGEGIKNYEIISEIPQLSGDVLILKDEKDAKPEGEDYQGPEVNDSECKVLSGSKALLLHEDDGDQDDDHHEGDNDPISKGPSGKDDTGGAYATAKPKKADDDGDGDDVEGKGVEASDHSESLRLDDDVDSADPVAKPKLADNGDDVDGHGDGDGDDVEGKGVEASDHSESLRLDGDVDGADPVAKSKQADKGDDLDDLDGDGDKRETPEENRREAPLQSGA